SSFTALGPLLEQLRKRRETLAHFCFFSFFHTPFLILYNRSLTTYTSHIEALSFQSKREGHRRNGKLVIGIICLSAH
ncbi:hypothetical protein AMELA_G00008850, partial [Ameiurus melas]